MPALHREGQPVLRRCAALVLALAFAAALAAPLLASARDGCARCGAAMKCCRAPAAGQERCGLSRACCSGADSDRLTVPRGAESSTAALAPIVLRPQVAERPVVAARTLLPSEHRSTPPDPPPRPSS